MVAWLAVRHVGQAAARLRGLLNIRQGDKLHCRHGGLAASWLRGRLNAGKRRQCCN
jgi:hypothetical protein